MANVALHEFVAEHRDEIVMRCRSKVASRTLPPPTEAEINHGVPLFLDQLVDALRLGQGASLQIEKTAVRHGHELLLQGFTVSQVVQDYGDVCQAITGVAVEMNAPISTDDFRTLNRCLDDAIASAVTEYGLTRNQSTIDEEFARGNERAGFLAHQVRNLADTAMLAFEALRRGNVGSAGSTAAVLHGSLRGIRALMNRSLADAHVSPPILKREKFLVSRFIEELAPAATLEANNKGITLTVMPVDDGVVIDGDRQVLAAVMGNLLQNAFKFTGPRSTVTLRVGTIAARVLIEVQDECGGLPDGNVTRLFRTFDELSADGSLVGLGLAFSRWGVEANDGRIYARNLPEQGCVFTVDLPRLPVSLSG